MKVVYKVLYPMGFEKNEVEDNFPTSLPFVEIKPLEALDNEQSQFFNFSAESLAQINSKTMLTSLQNTKEIDAIKEQIGGAK